MATRGIFQLRTLTLSYCEHGGSSKAVRDFLASGKLIDWAKERPSVEIRVRVKNGKHPNVKGEYLTGVDGSVHQVCLKSNAARTPDIGGTLDKLFNKSGRKMTKLTKPVYTDTPSVQGVWTPALNLHLQPEFPMEIKGTETSR
jgi:large subunit ribosomal protein L43